MYILRYPYQILIVIVNDRLRTELVHKQHVAASVLDSLWCMCRRKAVRSTSGSKSDISSCSFL